ncbi:TauD/TfdA family dioxygenase [Streptosporangium sp. NBC_01810]|uniref:TauD/TfdA dioxygenase family protein n=1 Tax=Streptosporangium sp. NBC_01810 TaxID=2975951 RepID=UPI002DDB331C|nr:TauD/TfdA family dioxygenase [Streptosporangium sp. NBC_01810]WSA27183.1 TauD/TfdA family dioxygenase [Streptosporangium sp. NBC_01810]
MIEFKPVTRHIGAEVNGVDLRRPLSEGEVREIRRGWLKHKVLFFRDQHISDEEHIRFAENFGSINHHVFRKDGGTAIHVLDQTDPKGEGGDEWRSDNTFEAPGRSGAAGAVGRDGGRRQRGQGGGGADRQRAGGADQRISETVGETWYQ